LCDTATVFISVVFENDPPVAVDDFFSIGCHPAKGNILKNDHDPEGDRIQLTLTPVQSPRHGVVVFRDDGEITYTVNPGFTGLDSLMYEICDDGYPSKCDTGTVYIEIFQDEDCDDVPDIVNNQIFVPEGFSPNGDGVHDFFQVVGIEDFPEAKMMIFNRWGNKIFEKERYGNVSHWGSDDEAWWWGYTNARMTVGGTVKVPVGNYLYVLDLGTGVVKSGTVMVSY
jgi:gliding motility-associated-like protein